MAANRRNASLRYGIGEWYGKSFVELSTEERIKYINVKSSRTQICIPRSDPDHEVMCTKRGGVCSIRLYKKDNATSEIEAVKGPALFSTLCPHRFKERNLIFKWVGETLIGTKDPIIVTEVGFLVRDKNEETINSSSGNTQREEEREDVGQIDYVLINPNTTQLNWCALELQAVYFSGSKMSEDYEEIRRVKDQSLPFPQKIRRPDFRSSGPKRLMPQLQIKVPTLRRWGKKLGVVVDRSFFNALGKMDSVADISNCDIVWFIVDYKEIDGHVQLVKDDLQYTTLEHAVEGLTAGSPVSLQQFETRITQKINIRS